MIVNRCDDGEEDEKRSRRMGGAGGKAVWFPLFLCSVPRLKKETEALLMDGPRRYDAMLSEFWRVRQFASDDT